MAERVVIAIPTYKRPRSLARLLDAIAGLRTDAEITVLVADNDAQQHQGFNLCGRLTPLYRWPLRAVMERDRGIAQARNRLVAEALKTDAQFIAMIDDDEWPDADWISAFLDAQRTTGAFDLTTFPGGHFYINDNLPELSHWVEERIPSPPARAR